MFGFDDAISGLFNIGNSQASAFANFEYQKKLMEYQDKYQRDFLRDSFGIRREGLEAAGYNPLLALDNMNSAGSVATGGSINMDTSNPFAASTNANSAKQQAKTAQKVTDSTIDVNSAVSAKTRAEANRIRVLTALEKSEIESKIRNLNANSSWHDRQTVERGGSVDLGSLGRFGVNWRKK